MSGGVQTPWTPHLRKPATDFTAQECFGEFTLRAGKKFDPVILPQLAALIKKKNHQRLYKLAGEKDAGTSVAEFNCTTPSKHQTVVIDK